VFFVAYFLLKQSSSFYLFYLLTILCCVYADEDSNGEIDQQELKHCFQKLDIESTDEEIKDLFQACDIYEHMGMKFNEFIVFLCLVYLLNDLVVSEAVSFIQ
jgi:hypothetical protein